MKTSGRGRARSVMVSGLEEFDAGLGNLIDQAVLLGDAARPAAGESISKWLGLARTVKRVAQCRFDQIEGFDGDVTVRPDPELQIRTEFGMKNGCPFMLPIHRESPAATERLWQAVLCRGAPG